MSGKEVPSIDSAAARRNNDDSGSLRVALAGATGVGRDYLRAIQDDSSLELVAIGDSDAETCRALHDALGVTTYEDFRSMLVECSRTGLDLIVVALEPFASHDLVQRAGRNGVGVVHKAPFARTTQEARALLRSFSEDGLRLFVPRFWHLEPAFEALSRITEIIGPIHAASADVTTTDTADGWRGDSVRAGGGVLLNGAYPCLDLLVATLGCPESVFARTSYLTVLAGPRTYDTEDSIALSLRFGQGCVATLSAVRAAPCASWRMTFHGASGIIELSDEGWRHLSFRDGTETQRARAGDNQDHASIRAFAQARRGRGRHRPTPGEDHIATLATLDASYLSVRTGAPETPRQFIS